jgi:AsmA protein
LDTTEVARKFRAVPKHIKLPLADIGAQLTLSPKKIRILAASVSAKSVKISAAGELSPPPAFAVSLGLKFRADNIRDLADMFSPLKEYSLTGSASGGADLAIAPKTTVMRGKAAFSNIGASAADTRLSEMTGTAEFSGDHFRADAAGRLEDSPLKLSVSAKNYSVHPLITLNADLETFKFKAVSPQQPQAGPAQAAAAKKEPSGAKAFAFDISGRARLGSLVHPNLKAGETVLTYNLKNVSENPGLMSGSAAFKSGSGKFENLYQLANQHKTAKIALYPLVILGKAGKLAKGLQLPDLNNIAFTKIEGDYTFQDGIMKIQKSVLNSDIADADTSGSINLVSDTLDLKMTTVLKQASGINLSAPLGMTVKGTFDAPSMKPDVKSIIAQPVVKDNVQKLLRKFLK